MLESGLLRGEAVDGCALGLQGRGEEGVDACLLGLEAELAVWLLGEAGGLGLKGLAGWVGEGASSLLPVEVGGLLVASRLRLQWVEAGWLRLLELGEACRLGEDAVGNLAIAGLLGLHHLVVSLLHLQPLHLLVHTSWCWLSLESSRLRHERRCAELALLEIVRSGD